MNRTLNMGDRGEDVAMLEHLLTSRGYAVEVDGIFGTQTRNAVRAFQSQNLDRNGVPLLVDGVAGPLTWWSLSHPKPRIETQSGIDFRLPPPEGAGGSCRGREALATAMKELRAGACEIGGTNRGPWVRKYLHGMAPQGSPWSTAFVSWCYVQGTASEPFPYMLSAHRLMRELRRRGWAHQPGSGYLPQAGDIVFWWKVRLDGWEGHCGIVHQLRDGILYTVEANKSSRVQGFSYVYSRMERLLGFGHVPD